MKSLSFAKKNNQQQYYAILFILGLMFFLNKPAMAFDFNHKASHKIGGNMLSLLAMGDLNGSYERSISSHFSLTSTLHYLTSSDVMTTEGTGFRVSAGARAYQKTVMKGLFLEFKGGYGYYKTKDGEQVTGKYGSPSAEFFAGYSKRFNENFYFDYKFGAMRLLNNGKILPSAGLNLGFNF